MEDYKKVPYTYEQHLELLGSRGLKVTSPDYAIQFLMHVNYYRFTAYCIPFQNTRDNFIPGTKFEDIAELYRLDESLRNAMMAALSPIEVCFRTRIAYELSHMEGAFAHHKSEIFHQTFDHNEWIASLEEATLSSKEKFLEHYRTKYNDFPRLPLWIACEIMSLGRLSQLYNGLLPPIQRKICSTVGIKYFVLGSWLHVVTYLRNICAHHSRLWNRELQIKPRLPNKDTKWTSLGLDNSHLFASVALIEWIYKSTNLEITYVEQVHEAMRKIAILKPSFSEKMGVPADREIGMCFD